MKSEVPQINTRRVQYYHTDIVVVVVVFLLWGGRAKSVV
jgi:hypothetical protein